MQELRRSRSHAYPRPPPCHLARRSGAEDGDGFRNANARILVWRPAKSRWRLAGVSRASWEYLPAANTNTLGIGRGVVDRRAGSLKVVTTNLKPGYLRKNGVPYSVNAILTEYFDRLREPNGDLYLLLTSTLEDPVYLAQPLAFSVHFKKQPDASGWSPSPCVSR